jgi:hypothetical protein
MNKAIVFLTLISLTGCEFKDNWGGASKMCTLMAGTSQISINIKSGNLLPKFLAAGINGDEIDIDECLPDPQQAGFDISRNFEQNEVQVRMLFLGSSEFSRYFDPQTGVPHEGATADFVLYGRSSCDDEPIEVTRFSNHPVSWEPGYPNGPDCGVSGYSSHLSVILP